MNIDTISDQRTVVFSRTAEVDLDPASVLEEEDDGQHRDDAEPDSDGLMRLPLAPVSWVRVDCSSSSLRMGGSYAFGSRGPSSARR
jgi:hypothetical protein